MEEEPLAKEELTSHINKHKDRWGILRGLSKACLPYLRATDFDVEATVNTIVAEDDMLLANFLVKTQQAQPLITILGISLSTNQMH